MTRTPSRHDRVWLDAATWRDALRSTLDDANAGEVDDWVRRGRALVTRRRDADSAADAVCLGIALPLASGRRRIGLVVDGRAAVRIDAPLALDEIVDAAPSRWHPALRDLRRRAAELATPLAVYGSFAWQAISGEACVTPTSDLDLVWAARDDDQVGRVIDLLLAWERDSGLRADGEARFAGGDAVAWRELATGASRVLVKNDHDVALKPRPSYG
jgi:phosphoribosyl-dephospho-CoA transferase